MIFTEEAPFHEWLAGQMRARQMSQRHLATRAGVHHSTVCRLLQGSREPLHDSVSRIVKVLTEDDGPVVTVLEPAARVERALRSDIALSEAAVHDLMLAYRARRDRDAQPLPKRPDPRARQVSVPVPAVRRLSGEVRL